MANGERQMYLKQYKLADIVSQEGLSAMDNKVIQVIKEVGTASSDNIVDAIIPGYKDNLHPENVGKYSIKKRMRVASDLRKTAMAVMQIDSSLTKLIKTGLVVKIKT